MNVLILGLGGESFEIRGKQLGGAIGARIAKRPQTEDLRWADLVVLIKRAGFEYASAVQAARKPIVWDALDYWHQPIENAWDEASARNLAKWCLSVIRPKLTVCATQAMADAHDGVYLPHHARPGLTAMPVKEKIEIVAYEGVPKYLGRWAKAISKECQRRGWTFVINPPNLATADLIVALRDGEWDGWMCRQWKSGVKYVNAMAAHRPVITQESAAWRELSGFGWVVETPAHLEQAFDLCDDAFREEVAELTEAAMEFDYSLEAVAVDYRAMLEQVPVTC